MRAPKADRGLSQAPAGRAALGVHWLSRWAQLLSSPGDPTSLCPAWRSPELTVFSLHGLSMETHSQRFFHLWMSASYHCHAMAWCLPDTSAPQALKDASDRTITLLEGLRAGLRLAQLLPSPSTPLSWQGAVGKTMWKCILLCSHFLMWDQLWWEGHRMNSIFQFSQACPFRGEKSWVGQKPAAVVPHISPGHEV